MHTDANTLTPSTMLKLLTSVVACSVLACVPLPAQSIGSRCDPGTSDPGAASLSAIRLLATSTDEGHTRQRTDFQIGGPWPLDSVVVVTDPAVCLRAARVYFKARAIPLPSDVQVLVVRIGTKHLVEYPGFIARADSPRRPNRVRMTFNVQLDTLFAAADF